MGTGMARMDMARRLKAHRVLSPILCFLALVGWGAFAYFAGSSASAERDLRAELAQSKASQDQLLAERHQQQVAVGDLTQLQAKLASAHQELETLAQKREQAKAQVAAV
jgi:cell division protein FtsB